MYISMVDVHRIPLPAAPIDVGGEELIMKKVVDLQLRANWRQHTYIDKESKKAYAHILY